MAISRKPRSRVSLDSDLHHPVSRAESATTGSVLLLAGGAVQNATAPSHNLTKNQGPTGVDEEQGPGQSVR